MPSIESKTSDPSSANRTEETSLLVVMFDDMQASTTVKRRLSERASEEAFHELRREHDQLVTEIVERGGAGEVIKSTGDGLIVIFKAPSVAVERAVEIQEALHKHPDLKVRIGMDMGEVRLEATDGRPTDVFGAHVDWAARAMGLVDGGHICVTAPVYRDAFSWIKKSRIAWKKHGLYLAKSGDTPLEVFQPYNANHHRPMAKLRGERVVQTVPSVPAPEPKAPAKDDAALALPPDDVQVIRPWESVARDGRDFAENGTGTMYWFKVPLGGLSYPDGFRHFLQPALENPRIRKIRFVLDSSNDPVAATWRNLVLPLIEGWAQECGCEHEMRNEKEAGCLTYDRDGIPQQLGWVFVDLSTEFTPCFKLFVDDPDSPDVAEQTAQIFLSTAQRMVRFADGATRAIRIPDAVLRVRPGRHEALLNALNAVANQWDSLFV